MTNIDMKELMKTEFKKIRNYPNWRTYQVIPITNTKKIDKETQLLRDSGIEFRKYPVQRFNEIIAVKIKIRE